MSPAQQLDLFDQLSYYEGADVEYKSAAGGLPRSLWETYSAFANTGGGTIWLGVAQKGGRLEVQGVEQPEKVVSDLWSLLNNREKVSRNLLSNEHIRVLPTPDPGRALLAMEVPRASRRDRPVYVGTDPFRGTYRRSSEGDYLCRDDEVRRMFADQADESADSRVLEGFGWDDVHPESLRQFRNRFASARPGHPWLAEDDLALLARLGGWRRDRQRPQEGLTVAGLLMFGREQAIRDPAAVPGFHLDYRERFSDDPAVRWTDRITLDGTWEGNLFQFYQRTLLKLSAGPGIKQPFQIDDEGYRRATTPVHEALQEALVNALIHADYAGQGGIVIDRYLDRFEFSNPGTLLLSREQLLEGGVSECRNRSLQQMFQMLGAGDKAGSGIDKIRTSWAAQHWQSPRLAESFRPDRVKLVLPMVSTLPEDVIETLGRRFGEAFQKRNADEVQALVTAEVAGEITNQRLQEALSLHRVDITRLLRGLVRDKLLIADGQGRGTRYFPADASGSRLHRAGNHPPDNVPSPPDNGSNPPDNGPSPPDNDPSAPDRSPDSLDPAGRLPDFEAELLAIAAPIRSVRRSRPAEMRNTILNLCNGRFLTLRQLSQLLHREMETLRDGFISPLVKEGVLELRHPDNPSRRDQAYRVRSGT